MIQFTLKCGNGHDFDSWFQSGEAFEALKTAGHVECPVCQDRAVEKSLMAPRVRPARNATAEPALAAPASPAEAKLAEMKKEIEANSEYVGLNFATEARAIHDGEAPERAIYGEAKADEAKKLIEDGVPVAPLPFVPGRKTN